MIDIKHYYYKFKKIYVVQYAFNRYATNTFAKLNFLVLKIY